MLTWEGTPVQGVQGIVEKLTVSFLNLTAQWRCAEIFSHFQSLPFQKVQHKITTIDAQPSSLTSANLLVSVMGFLVVRILTSSLHFVDASTEELTRTRRLRLMTENIPCNSVRSSSWFRIRAATTCM